MFNPEVSEYKAVCHSSTWRPLHSGKGHPNHYIQLISSEVRDLVTTGSFYLPDSVIPDSVRAWRESQMPVVENV